MKFSQLFVLFNLLVIASANMSDKVDTARNFWEKNKAFAPVALALCLGMLIFCCCYAIPRLVKTVSVLAILAGAGYFGYKSFVPK